VSIRWLMLLAIWRQLPPKQSPDPNRNPHQVVNKMDRPALNGFEIIEQLEKEFGLTSFPVTWPIGSGDRFCGLYHRPTRQVGAGAWLRSVDVWFGGRGLLGLDRGFVFRGWLRFSCSACVV